MRYTYLTYNNEFSRAYSKGKSYVHPHIVMYVNKNRFGKVRLGLTATKKIGNAVTRNRARRVMRAAISAVLTPEVMENIGGKDLVFVSRGVTPKLKSTILEKDITALLTKAGLLK